MQLPRMPRPRTSWRPSSWMTSASSAATAGRKWVSSATMAIRMTGISARTPACSGMGRRAQWMPSAREASVSTAPASPAPPRTNALRVRARAADAPVSAGTLPSIRARSATTPTKTARERQAVASTAASPDAGTGSVITWSSAMTPMTISVTAAIAAGRSRQSATIFPLSWSPPFPSPPVMPQPSPSAMPLPARPVRRWWCSWQPEPRRDGRG